MKLSTRFALVLLLPALIVLTVFYVYPVINVYRLSFISREGVITFGNYMAFAQTSVYLSILWRTIYISAIVTAVCFIVAYPYALLLLRVGRRMRALLIAVILIPLWTSLLARTYAWIILLADVGPIRSLLLAVGIDIHLLGELSGVVIGMSQVLLPFMALPLYNSMRTLDVRLVGAARSLGATKRAAFWQVFFPLTLPGISAGTVMVFILGLGFYITPSLLGSPSQMMLAQLIAQEISLKLDWGSAGAMSAILSALTLLMLLIAAKTGGKQILKGGVSIG